MGNWNEYEKRIDEILREIFKNEDFNNLTTYEKRKKIYDYLYNTLSFDFNELYNNSKDVDKQIKDVLYNQKGICNSIIYVYKIILEKVDVYSMVLFCKDEKDDHTILLVENGDGTFSFDDLSITIRSKNKHIIKAIQKERFDYDLEDSAEINQGINKVFEDYKYLMIPSEDINHFFGKDDNYFKYIRPFFESETNFFKKFDNYIKSVKKESLNVNRVSI